jgi:hypothetical protein
MEETLRKKGQAGPWSREHHGLRGKENPGVLGETDCVLAKLMIEDAKPRVKNKGSTKLAERIAKLLSCAGLSEKS